MIILARSERVAAREQSSDVIARARAVFGAIHPRVDTWKKSGRPFDRDIISYRITARIVPSRASGDIHAFQTIPLLLVSPSSPRTSISSSSLSAVLCPLQYRFQSALPPSPRVHSPSRSALPRRRPVSAVSVRLFHGSGSFTFPVDSMRKSPARVSGSGLFGAGPSWIALTQNSLHFPRKLSCAPGALSAPVVYDYRPRETIRARAHAKNWRDVCARARELWRFASRIMLSCSRAYALRSATSAKSRSLVLLRRDPRYAR